MSEDIKEPVRTYFGQSLEEAITIVTPERKALIDNYLYEKSALLLYADDGVGKSVLCLQSCLQSTMKDNMVFGEFYVPEPCRILYFQMERHPDESFERIKNLRTSIAFDLNNFALSVCLQGTNLQSDLSKREAIAKVAEVIKEIGFKPNIIAFDPIYPLAQDGLETAVACNAITSFFRILQITYDCTIYATSHTNRGIKKASGQRVGKDMYGNRFLSAFFTASYSLTMKSDHTGTLLTLDKNSQKNLEKKFGLNYDASCYRSWIDTEGAYTKKDRLDNFLKTCKISNREFSFKDMQTASEVSDSCLRGYLAGYLKESLVISSKLKQGKVLYRFLG